MNRIIIILILLFSFGCSADTKLTDQPRTKLRFENLPDTIKTIYISSLSPGFIDELNMDRWDKEPYKIINLDSEVKKTEYEIVWTGPWIDEFRFMFDDKMLKMEFNGNSINEPYILLNKELYFIATLNVSSKDDLANAEFGKYNLKKALGK